MEKKVVEVVAEGEDGIIPLGIMNVEQAMTLPSDVDVKSLTRKMNLAELNGFWTERSSA